MVLILGPHISVSDGLKKAIKNVKSMKGNAMQIFTGPPQSYELGKMVSESNDELKKIDNDMLSFFDADTGELYKKAEKLIKKGIV